MSIEPSAEIEIYPMPSFPTLMVSDIQASALWYCKVLGFTHVFTMPGPNGVPSLCICVGSSMQTCFYFLTGIILWRTNQKA